MPVTVNKLDYIYKKILHEAKSKMNDTIEISDEEYGIIYGGNNGGSDSGNQGGNNNEPIVDPSEEDDHDYSQDYLTFEALEDGTFSFTVNDLYYSTNNGESWKSLAAGMETELITAGTKVLWKRDSTLKLLGNTSGTGGNNIIGTFSSTNKFNVSGNILSLFYVDNFYEYNTFQKYNQLSEYNTKKMFNNCINLISAKNLILPSVLTEYCFAYMFNGCTSLVIAPTLWINTVSERCCNGMFYNCSSLNYIKCLIKNTPYHNLDYYFEAWVTNVSNSGTFIKNSKTIFDIGDSGIPGGWEVIDEVVPEE